jgi:hypothetical protein
MDRGKWPAEIVMPVWTNTEDNLIAFPGGAEFLSKALFREENSPASLKCESHVSDKDQFILS